MFERYTETGRQAIFSARYEARQLGGGEIQTQHLLLGILRTNAPLALRLLGSQAKIESIRGQIRQGSKTMQPVSASVGMPLSKECKLVLAYAAEEAERLNHKQIGTEHLLLGLFRMSTNCWATRILLESGLTIPQLQEEARSSFATGTLPTGSAEAVPLVKIFVI